MKTVQCLVFSMVSIFWGTSIARDKADNSIYFDIEGRNVGAASILSVSIEFDDFKFNWGSLDSHITSAYLADVPRNQPKSATLDWKEGTTGENIEVNVPVPELPDHFRKNNMSFAYGKNKTVSVILRFDIDPDSRTACAIWTNVAYPANDVKCK